MGVFYERSDLKPRVSDALASALRSAPPTEDQVTPQAQQTANTVVDGSSATLQVGRLVIAILIVMALLGMAIGTDAAGLNNSSKSLYPIAATAFGIVAGLLGGEAQKS